MHYAHTHELHAWQPLSDHLLGTSDLCKGFSAAFDSGPWGELAGFWHDLGKFAEDWQDYLKQSAIRRSDASVDDADASKVSGRPGRLDHSSAGAVLVFEKGGRVFSDGVAALSMAIGGHHSGLGACLDFAENRLLDPDKLVRWQKALAAAPPEDLIGRTIPELPPFLRPDAFSSIADRKERADRRNLRFELWTRMLFSALIDADRLDTELFDDRTRYQVRQRAATRAGDLPRLIAPLDAELGRIAAESRQRLVEFGGAARDRYAAVLAMRDGVLGACRAAALRPRGRHSLTVPTGGGKTLAALAFALSHAAKRDLRRVIVVIPYTSIIDQTADVYRRAFACLGRAARSTILEHHSNLDPAKETVGNRLAGENWEAPIVVTTAVQFFESLFTDKGTSARKLHNIARSVLVFDEVQTLPPQLRAPIFDVLNQLVDFYGCSALFCTATQPILDRERVNNTRPLPHFKNLSEIIPDVPGLFRSVSDRVRVEYPTSELATPWGDLADRVVRESADRSALVIVHRREDARRLCELLPPGTFHLSALMCAAHRKHVLAEIREGLISSRVCRVVSTTLIECGVDVDFPVVFKCMGGMDSMAQAAGRCNREGKLTDPDGAPIPGRLILFHAESKPPEGLQRGLETTKAILVITPDLDLFDPTTHRRYFGSFYSKVSPDSRDVMGARKARDFPETAKRFRMIDEDGQVAIVVPYGESEVRVDAYSKRPGRKTLRGLQPYVVDVPAKAFALLSDSGCIRSLNDHVHQLLDDGARRYDARLGLKLDHVPPRETGLAHLRGMIRMSRGRGGMS